MKPLERELFVALASPCVPQAKSPHEHPGATSAPQGRGLFETAGGLFESVGFVVTDAEREVVFWCFWFVGVW